jgi:hypothetical protein
MASDVRSWIDRYAETLGVPTLQEDEIDVLLELARIAAHSSERPAAPISCWLAARSGLAPIEALSRAQVLAANDR